MSKPQPSLWRSAFSIILFFVLIGLVSFLGWNLFQALYAKITPLLFSSLFTIETASTRSSMMLARFGAMV